MTTAPNTETLLEEDFGKAFEQLSELGDKPTPRDFSAAEPAPAADAEPASEIVDPPPAAAAADDEPAAAVAAEDARVAAPAAPAAEAPTEHLLERFVRAVETRQPAPQPAPQQTPPQEPQLYAPDEIEALTNFEKDWPDVAKAIQLMLRGTVTQNNAAVFQRLGEVLGPQLAGVQDLQVNHQLNTLRQAIPDYDQVRDPVIAWVNTDNSIPAYLRTAYKGVIEQGDVSDIADLVDRWRQVSGKAAPAAAAAAAPTAAKPANELSEAAKQAAQSLAPVVSKRTVTAPSTPTTFEDAFEVAAAALTKA